jgi:sugar O-acyltransferase (sialic acid O-acetyltransferase NeuD family)
VNAPVIIVGAGGHASVVADVLLAMGRDVIGYTDSNPSLHGTHICGVPVLGDDGILARHSATRVRLVNGLAGVRGERLRRDVQGRLEAMGWHFCGVRHPSAIVSPFAQIGKAVHLMAGCIVQPGAVIGGGCIINTGAIVEHDAAVGEYVHVAPRALVCGGASIGDYGHLGAGAVVLQGVTIGSGTIVGAGAVVVVSHPGAATLVGVPARSRGPSA